MMLLLIIDISQIQDADVLEKPSLYIEVSNRSMDAVPETFEFHASSGGNGCSSNHVEVDINNGDYKLIAGIA